jgi:hypothetical protein
MNYLNRIASYNLFSQEKNSEIFVDKSLLIEAVSKKIGTNGKYLCITRPRRFGKTVNANMLAAYFSKGYDSRPLFDQLQISSSKIYGKDQNKCNVIYMDFSRQPLNCECYSDYIEAIFEWLKEDIEAAYPDMKRQNWRSMDQLLLATEDHFIFVLDEWDSIFYEPFMSNQDKNRFLKFLKGLLKDQPYVDLAYMTGVLPIAKYSSGSELNMFDEYNFMNDNIYDKYFGFSEEEVRALCREHGTLSFEDLKQWYDGYHFSNGESLFNPRSVNKALSRGTCLNYWTETGPMNEIADCIEHNVAEVREDIVKMVSGVPVEVELDGYSAAELRLDSRDEILSAMVVYGFLDYYDGYLRIPNRELMEKYQKVLSRDSMGEVKEIVDQSRSMLEATLAADQEKVAQILERVHDREIPFLKYNDENALSCVITLCYLYARKDYRMEREQKSGKGYCDYFFFPRKTGKPAIILELKVGKSAEEAIAQIKEKNYLQKAESYGKAILVGINYDEVKHHTCKIEQVIFDKAL